MYWLHVEFPGTLTLQDLDSFLRYIWLECCGHLSNFTTEGQRYDVCPDDQGHSPLPVKDMSCRLAKVLAKGMTFQHEYDFGSTTVLKLRVAAVRERSVKNPKVSLLAMNDPPPWKCAKCDKPGPPGL